MRGWEAQLRAELSPGNCPTGLLQWARIPGSALQTAAQAGPPGCPEHRGCGDRGCPAWGKPSVPGPRALQSVAGARGRNQASGAAAAQGRPFSPQDSPRCPPLAPRKHGRPRPMPDDHEPCLQLHSPGPEGLPNPLPPLYSPAVGRGVEADYCAAHRSNLKLTPAHALRPREGPLGSRGLREAIRHGLTCLSHRAAWPPSTSPCPTSPGKGAKQPHSFYRCLPNPSFCSAESNFFFWSTHGFRALYNRYEARQQRFPPHPTGEEEGKGPARTTEPPVQALPPPSSSFQAPPCPSAQ